MPNIPKVLLLGDSIRLSYQPHVARLLDGKAQVVGPADNCAYTPTSFRMPREGYYFDDISFNEPGATIDPAAFRPSTGFTDEQLSALQARGKFLYENTGYALLGWGGGDTQRVLTTATPEEIRAHVRERLGIFKPGGGYVFNQVHNIQSNVPAENVIAMLDAAYEYG